MQRREAKGFFFNSVFKRPIILRSLLRGQGHQPKGEIVREEVEAGGQSNADMPFRKGVHKAREGSEKAEKICGL
ncbi:MAG: hypothetical protein H5T72_04695 [Actinobacteria bacterium]|nr:hypothetical protein [Actinomycetota bacterium]